MANQNFIPDFFHMALARKLITPNEDLGIQNITCRMGSFITLLLNWEKYNNSTNLLGNPEMKNKHIQPATLFGGDHLPVLRHLFFVATWVARSGIDINSTKDLLVQRRWGVWAQKSPGGTLPQSLKAILPLKIGLNYPKRKPFFRGDLLVLRRQFQKLMVQLMVLTDFLLLRNSRSSLPKKWTSKIVILVLASSFLGVGCPNLLASCTCSAPSNTPWKINMEPTNHPFGKENDLNQTSRKLWSSR